MTNIYLNADQENEIIGGLTVEYEVFSTINKETLDKLQLELKLSDITMLEIIGIIESLEGEWLRDDTGELIFIASDSDIEKLIKEIDELIGNDIDPNGAYLDIIQSIERQDPADQIKEKVIRLLYNKTT